MHKSAAHSIGLCRVLAHASPYLLVLPRRSLRGSLHPELLVTISARTVEEY